jgi:predicted Zn finger-like uncharacterized protein
MSLLTRCPACETLFKLVPDQLRISQGWVKCGQCSEIFDASKHLIQVAVESEMAVESPFILATPDAAPAASLAPASDVVVATAPDMADGAQLDQVAAEPTSATVSEAQCRADVEIPTEPVAATEPEPTDGTQDGTASVVVSQLPLDESLLPEAVEELPKVSFLGDSPRHSGWHSRGGKFFLWLAVLLLGAGLGFQGLYWERDRLAAAYPDLKPLLQQMCQPLNCSIQTLQRIDAIAIDSATFNRLGPDSYRLSFVIKNLSNLAVALPSVELTLTDTQEQVMVRRALFPQELFAVTPALFPGIELPVNLVLGLDLGEAAPRVIGYRLLAFYP